MLKKCLGKCITICFGRVVFFNKIAVHVLQGQCRLADTTRADHDDFVQWQRLLWLFGHSWRRMSETKLEKRKREWEKEEKRTTQARSWTCCFWWRTMRFVPSMFCGYFFSFSYVFNVHCSKPSTMAHYHQSKSVIPGSICFGVWSKRRMLLSIFIWVLLLSSLLLPPLFLSTILHHYIIQKRACDKCFIYG